VSIAYKYTAPVLSPFSSIAFVAPTANTDILADTAVEKPYSESSDSPCKKRDMMKGEDKLSRNPTSRSGSKTVGRALSGADAVGGVAISVVGDDVTVASSVGDTAGVLTD